GLSLWGFNLFYPSRNQFFIDLSTKFYLSPLKTSRGRLSPSPTWVVLKTIQFQTLRDWRMNNNEEQKG
ncbi:MAG: hypothetical protein ACYDEJ_08760, partial [Desulfitobacteriaceae bacterium]